MSTKMILLLLIFTSSNIQSQEKIIKSEAEWKRILSPTEYYVLREKGTERATTGVYTKFYEKGIYNCAACNTALFESQYKYNSYSGWPAFDRSIKKNVTEIVDKSYGMARVEVVCAICEGHLGHVFEDGPKTTGRRYCINSVSLKFESKN
jgi:peptide-methionine (R)-S-oxide reductase